MSKITEMTLEEYLAKGKELYGENTDEWKYKCPACGHIQTIKDFKPYKEKGATPNSATEECIGRYTGGEWIGKNGKKTTSPCNYAGYGLFRISPIRVKLKDGETTHSFAFAN